MRDSVRSIVDLNVIIDFPKSEHHDKYRKEKGFKDLYLWTPESLFYFYPDIQDIDVSFVGSVRYADRSNYLQELKQYFPTLVVAGGQRESGLTFSAYANLIRRSKININFSKNPQLGSYYQLKGRVLEILACKSLLIDEKNPATASFFTPNIDYVDFENILELKQKIEYYLTHTEEREKIASSGHKKLLEKYTARHFWMKVMQTIEHEGEN